ncbi:Reverse transcriptase domain-containing protein [Trichostrongylus colubriformis]|uniref:Reverse transcriptase domain-containing protein n=1 Tax=Trichostrongylus colubriformis TaxID=6319 RepID=A0AAN8FVY4_TRICO
MLALIDTGAAITVSSRGITDLIGVFKLQPSPVRSALGMAGIPVLLAGTARVHIQIGSIALDHLVYFTNGPCVPRQVDKYNIILGNDLLARLPPWHINYSRGSLSVGKETIPILTLDVPPRSLSPYPDVVTIRATATSVVPPRTETLVRCSAISPILLPLMMVTQASALSDKHLFIAPAVFYPERAVVLITNPTSRPEVVYERQQLGTAIPLTRDASGILMDSSSIDDSFREAPLDALPTIAVTDRDPTVTEPTLNVDLSQSDVTDDEKAQLRQVFIEYRDRISNSSYDLGSYTHTLVNIKTTVDTPPSRFRPPRIPVKFQRELDDHINKLLKAGRIVESDTPWVHNTVLVKKRDGSLRVCLDFRPLNDITVPEGATGKGSCGRQNSREEAEARGDAGGVCSLASIGVGEAVEPLAGPGESASKEEPLSETS